MRREVRSAGWGESLGTEPSFQRKLRRVFVAGAVALPVALAPEMSSAEGLLDFFFGGSRKQQPQSSFFEKVFNANVQPTPSERSDAPSQESGLSSGPSF